MQKHKKMIWVVLTLQNVRGGSSVLWKDGDPNCAAFLGERGDRTKERLSGQVGRGVDSASS